MQCRELTTTFTEMITQLTYNRLGIAFNALPGQQPQADFKAWAQGRYSEAWAALESKGKRLNRDSLCQYKLNRIMRA